MGPESLVNVRFRQLSQENETLWHLPKVYDCSEGLSGFGHHSYVALSTSCLFLVMPLPRNVSTFKAHVVTFQNLHSYWVIYVHVLTNQTKRG